MIYVFAVCECVSLARLILFLKAVEILENEKYAHSQTKRH